MYHLTINTPEKIVFDASVTSVIAPGTEGYLQILTDHAALVTALKRGKLTVRDKEGKSHLWTVTGGLLEVRKNEAVLLADDVIELSEGEKNKWGF